MVIHDPVQANQVGTWRSTTFPGQKHNPYFEIQKQVDEQGQRGRHRVVTKSNQTVFAIAHGNTEFEIIQDWQTLTMVLFPKIQEQPTLENLTALMKTVKTKLINSLMFETSVDGDFELDFGVALPVTNNNSDRTGTITGYLADEIKRTTIDSEPKNKRATIKRSTTNDEDVKDVKTPGQKLPKELKKQIIQDLKRAKSQTTISKKSRSKLGEDLKHKNPHKTSKKKLRDSHDFKIRNNEGKLNNTDGYIYISTSDKKSPRRIKKNILKKSFTLNETTSDQHDKSSSPPESQRNSDLLSTDSTQNTGEEGDDINININIYNKYPDITSLRKASASIPKFADMILLAPRRKVSLSMKSAGKVFPKFVSNTEEKENKRDNNNNETDTTIDIPVPSNELPPLPKDGNNEDDDDDFIIKDTEDSFFNQKKLKPVSRTRSHKTVLRINDKNKKKLAALYIPPSDPLPSISGSDFSEEQYKGNNKIRKQDGSFSSSDKESPKNGETLKEIPNTTESSRLQQNINTQESHNIDVVVSRTSKFRKIRKNQAQSFNIPRRAYHNPRSLKTQHEPVSLPSSLESPHIKEDSNTTTNKKEFSAVTTDDLVPPRKPKFYRSLTTTPSSLKGYLFHHDFNQLVKRSVNQSENSEKEVKDKV